MFLFFMHGAYKFIYSLHSGQISIKIPVSKKKINRSLVDYPFTIHFILATMLTFTVNALLIIQKEIIASLLSTVCIKLRRAPGIVDAEPASGKPVNIIIHLRAFLSGIPEDAPWETELKYL